MRNCVFKPLLFKKVTQNVKKNLQKKISKKKFTVPKIGTPILYIDRDFFSKKLKKIFKKVLLLGVFGHGEHV